MGMGKGLLDSLIAEGEVKSRDLRKLGIYMGMDIEIRRGRSDRNATKFYGYPYFTFYLEEIFCTYQNSTTYTKNKGGPIKMTDVMTDSILKVNCVTSQ